METYSRGKGVKAGNGRGAPQQGKLGKEGHTVLPPGAHHILYDSVRHKMQMIQTYKYLSFPKMPHLSLLKHVPFQFFWKICGFRQQGAFNILKKHCNKSLLCVRYGTNTQTSGRAGAAAHMPEVWSEQCYTTFV